MKIVMTVCYVIMDIEILLGLKLVRMGKRLFNGYGGRLEPNETIEKAAIRELVEESGIRALSIKKCGVALTNMPPSSDVIELHFFLVDEFIGEAKESDEMIPYWFLRPNIPCSLRPEIPYSKMWANDLYLLPLFLRGQKCVGRFILEDPRTIIRHQIQVVDVLPDSLELEWF